MQGDLFGGHPTLVVNVKHAKCEVYCGRAMPGQGYHETSVWANPYRIKVEAERPRAITNFKADLLDNPVLLLRIPELRGKVLGCWCAPKACHCHVLAELADAPAPRLLELHMAARRTFGGRSSPPVPPSAWLPWLIERELLPAGLVRWSEIQQEHGERALKLLADLHRGVAKWGRVA